MPQQRAACTRGRDTVRAHADPPQQLWKILDANGSTRDLEATAMAGLSLESADVLPETPRNIAMPAARTELSEMLAADGTLCVNRGTPKRAAALRLHTADAQGAAPPATDSRTSSPAATDPLAALSNCQPAKPRRAAANASRRREIDSRLARVIDAWPTLPKTVRAAILAMVDTARECGGTGR